MFTAVFACFEVFKNKVGAMKPHDENVRKDSPM